MINFKLQKDKIIKLHEGKNVFKPTQTTQYLYDSIIKNFPKKKISVADMGCGNGVLGIGLLKTFKNIDSLLLSDISKDALIICKKNVRINLIKLEKIKYIESSIFNNFEKIKFDVIVNDISGISEEVAKISPWFNNISCKSGLDGTDLTINFLKNYKNFLNKNGKVFFPIISLSNESKIFRYLKKNNIRYKILLSNSWPLPQNMMVFKEKLKKLKNKKYIFYKKKFNLLIATTKIIKLF
jgi:release factor glutamine methyltransferase